MNPRGLAAGSFINQAVRSVLAISHKDSLGLLNINQHLDLQFVMALRRTALYARVSTADQKNGLEAQVRALRIFCEQNKIENYELFCDENISGTKASRPGLDRMMKAVEAGEIDSVVVFAFSRFARSVSHMLKGLEIMKKYQTNFISLTEKIDLNTSLGHVVFVLVSAIAQLERDLISDDIKNSITQSKV